MSGAGTTNMHNSFSSAELVPEEKSIPVGPLGGFRPSVP